jgi:hypothetical protein
MSILPLFPSASFEPLQQTDEGPVEVISEDQISALESLPTSVKVSGRTENSTASPWGWAVKAGGSAGEMGYGIAVDSSGNAYVTGEFSGTATFGSTNLTSSGSYDIFIAKLSSSGSWQWVVKAGGSASDNGMGIAVDSSGNAYVTGSFYGTATFGSTSLTSSGSQDIFIAKLSSSGSWLWAVKAGGSFGDYGRGIAVDSTGNAYATGNFKGTATFGSTSLESNGGQDIFIVKLSSSGSWQWAVKSGGSSGSDGGYGIAVDSSGNAYVTGIFAGTANFGSTSLTSSGGNVDIFIAKLSSSGSWQWAVKAGGSSGSDGGYGIAVDSSGNAYATGFFRGTATFGSTSLVSSGSYDIFIAKLSNNGSWQWAVKAGGSSDDYGYGIAVDSSGNAYVTGYFLGTATFGSTSLTSSGDADIFIAIHQDQDMDGVNNSVDSCPDGVINWMPDSSTDYDSDGCRDADEDNDDDDDGITDASDACEKGVLGWTSDSLNDYDSDGCRDVDEDDDDDDDEITDSSDTCEKGVLGWTPDSSTDYDSDGCRDVDEDDDDDDDGITDASDACEKGDLGWASSSSTDYDGDGCKDATEDMDDDDDGITDASDACKKGVLGWIFDLLTDYDSDGCRDVDEDDDDDDDGITDASDACEKGVLVWTPDSSTDYDSDGCRDVDEDDDDDDDGITDASDSCENGDLGWISNPSTDHDGDGCQDSTEDMDDDDDGITDASDACQKGVLVWTPDSSTDYDADGCKDATEDTDDDDDGIIDTGDACQKGDLGWISNPSTDHDGDGCQDSIEDMDDDDDGITDASDACQKGDLGWTSSSSTDHDGDGCQDSIEDMDDDDDGIADELDDCSSGNYSWISKSSTDHDSDGCQDLDEDEDDDNDGVNDLLDICPKGQLGWFSSKSADFDSDGCQDSSEDVDDDNDGVLDAIEINAGANPLDASSKPIDSFSVVVGNIELSTWDLVGIVLATLTSGFLAFAFVTRKGRYDAFSLDINDAQYSSLGKLEKKLELASFFRLLSPRQSIKLETLLDTRKEDLGLGSQVDEPVSFTTQGGLTPSAQAQPPMEYQIGVLDGEGYEWIKREDGDWYRVANSGSEYARFNR